MPVFRPLIGFDKQRSSIFPKNPVRTEHLFCRMRLLHDQFLQTSVTKPNLNHQMPRAPSETTRSTR